MMVFGVDASLTRTAIVALPSAAHTFIPTSPDMLIHRRLRRIAEDGYAFVEGIRQGAPALIVVEAPGFQGKNGGNAAVAVGMARGAFLAAMSPVDAVTVLEVPVMTVRRDVGIPSTRPKDHIDGLVCAKPCHVCLVAGLRKRGEQVQTPAKERAAAFLFEQGIELPRKRNGRIDDDVVDAWVLAIWGQRFGARRVGL